MKKISRMTILLMIFILICFVLTYRYKSASSNWVRVKQGPVISAIYGLGTVTSDRIYHLKVGVTSSVKQLFVHEGDEVKAGQPLVQMNNLPLIKANFSGTITSLPLHINETVYPQTEILTLMDLTSSYVLVSLEQEAAMKIQKGQQVKLTFSGLPNESFAGTVYSIYPKAQEFYVKIIPEKLSKTILPEMSSDVAIILERKENAILIPAQAIQNAMLTIRRNGKVEQVAIEVGAANGNEVEVISNNIKLNDEVLVKA